MVRFFRKALRFWFVLSMVGICFVFIFAPPLLWVGVALLIGGLVIPGLDLFLRGLGISLIDD